MSCERVLKVVPHSGGMANENRRCAGYRGVAEQTEEATPAPGSHTVDGGLEYSVFFISKL